MMETILLLGHGSRAPGASDAMEAVAADLRARRPEQPVLVCHMELCEPTLEDTLDLCAEAGRFQVAILPYFLHLGMHLREDIPQILDAARERHPALVIRLCPPIGYDHRIAAIVEQRLAETL